MKTQTVAITLSPELAELLAELAWLEREHPGDFQMMRRLGHQFVRDRHAPLPDPVGSKQTTGGGVE